MLIEVQTTQIHAPCQGLMVDDVLQLQKVVCHLFLTRYIQRCKQADIDFTLFRPLVVYRKALFDAEYADSLPGGYKQARKACLQAILALGKRGIVQYLDDQMMINYAKYKTVTLGYIERRIAYLQGLLDTGKPQGPMMRQRIIHLQRLQTWLEEV